MQLSTYHLSTERNFSRFTFISEGPKGNIGKLIEFQITEDAHVYNLAFGDEDPSNNTFDDLAVTNNGDTEKVLATVIDAVYIFFRHFPTAYVYATGSTKARTRLYRMGITKHYNKIQQDFYLYGHIGDDYLSFEIGKDYDGFLAQRKFY